MDRGRALLLAPPAAACVSAALLALVSFSAYGAADHLGYSAWTPVIGGLLYAIPAFAVGGLELVRLYLATPGRFTIRLAPAVLGASGFIGVAAVALAYCVAVGDAGTYEGSFNAITGKVEPLFNQTTFFFTSITLGAMVPGAALVLSRLFYYGALDLGKQKVEGKDAVASLFDTP